MTRKAWISAIAAPATAATPRARASDTAVADLDPLDGPEPHHGPDEHHPLHSEVEHARALGQELPERGEERPVQHGRGSDHDEEALVDPARHEPAGHDATSGGDVVRRGSPRRAPEANPVPHEYLAAQRAEQDQSLHDADEAGREVRSLQCVKPAFCNPLMKNLTGTTASGL